MNEWRAFMRAHIPNGDLKDGSYPFAYGIAQTLMHVLRASATAISRATTS